MSPYIECVIITISLLWVPEVASQTRQQLCQSWCVARCQSLTVEKDEAQCERQCSNFGNCTQIDTTCLRRCGQLVEDAPKILPRIELSKLTIHYVGEPEDSAVVPDPLGLRVRWDAVSGAIFYVVEFNEGTNVTTKIFNANTTTALFRKTQICAPVGIRITYVTAEGISQSSMSKNKSDPPLKYTGGKNRELFLDSFAVVDKVVEMSFDFDLPPGWTHDDIQNINVMAPATDDFVRMVEFSSNGFKLKLKEEYFMAKIDAPIYIFIKSMENICGTTTLYDIQFGYWIASDCVYKRTVYKDYPQFWTDCVTDNYRCDMTYTSTEDYSNVNGTSCLGPGMSAEINVSWVSQFGINEPPFWYYELLEWEGGERDTLDKRNLIQLAKEFVNESKISLNLTPGKYYYLLACEIFNPYLTLNGLDTALQSTTIMELNPTWCETNKTNPEVTNIGVLVISICSGAMLIILVILGASLLARRRIRKAKQQLADLTISTQH